MEKWIQWFPRKNMPLPCYVKSILSDDTGLTITFTDETKKKKITFTFNGILYTYRYTSEGCFLKTLDYLTEHYESNFVHGTSLYKVKNSKYLEWFRAESYNAYEVDRFEHYVFYTEDDVVEVLSHYEPEVEIKNIV